jgi:hypothetical protein
VDATEKEQFDNMTAQINQSEDMYKIIHKNGAWNINFNKMFSDPDGDALTFNATSDTNTTITIRGKSAKVTPDTEFFGKQTVQFFATDSSNATTSSPLIDVYVSPEESHWRTCFWYYVASFILFILAVLCFIMYFVKKA